MGKWQVVQLLWYPPLKMLVSSLWPERQVELKNRKVVKMIGLGNVIVTQRVARLPHQSGDCIAATPAMPRHFSRGLSSLCGAVVQMRHMMAP